ncbi:hypothetical protein E2C01_018882 [Portunus trituberculatus]|uniref:Uncharacterized protein n=1 Tax=Portunus trituberculatus TaxID=210409 RepID=A0A5B7DW82_PORTR|nr:hypothetical protein [Portunus trituberculatus]
MCCNEDPKYRYVSPKVVINARKFKCIRPCCHEVTHPQHTTPSQQQWQDAGTHKPGRYTPHSAPQGRLGHGSLTLTEVNTRYNDNN